MPKNQRKNPLLDAQRETAGSATFGKYRYQYHWGLYRAIARHRDGNEYALIVELHEDVVFADSLDESKANFEFSQVKEMASSLTAKALIRVNGTGSILGKLLSSGVDKPYSERLVGLNLVSTGGFSLPLAKEGLRLDVIAPEDLDSDTLKTLSDAIKAELKLDPLPTILRFVVPDLPAARFEEVVIAAINRLVDDMFPGSRTNALEIYRVLYDDLEMKGTVAIDIKDWDDFLKRKALTCESVTQVINQFTNIPNEGQVQVTFNQIAAEMGLTTVTSKALQRSFLRYRQQRMANISVRQLDLTSEISTLINQVMDENIQEISRLVDVVLSRLSLETKQQFASDDDLRAAIICEFIESN